MIKNIQAAKKTARVAGLLYFLQIPLGVFGIIYVSKVLFVPGDLAATANNILANEFLFRLSIVSALLTAILTVFTALFLYKVLKPVNKYAAKLMVLFTVIVAPITMINELNHVAILLLLKGPEQWQTLVPFFFDLHAYGMQIVGIFFGLWLLPMGYLVYKSKYIPKFIGIFLVITCLGYLIDFVTFFLFPNFGIVVSEYTWLGEVMMVSWLLIKGVDGKQWEKYSSSSQLK
jgi:hypothetical protein